MRRWGRFLGRFGRALTGLVLVVGLVIALAALPRIVLYSSPQSLFDYRVEYEKGAWSKAVTGYLGLLADGTLGRDRNGTPIAPMLRARLSFSLTLMGVSLFLALTLGVIKGVWDFRQLRRRRLALGPLVTGAVQGLPDFLLVFLLQYGGALVFQATGWRPFPVGWMAEQPLRSLVFPVISLTLIPWAYVARLTCTAMNQVWDEDFIRTAHAKGLSAGVVVYRHAFRNAVILILEGLPNLLVVVVSNLLIVEYLFNLPGLTILLKDAIVPLPLARGFDGRPTGPASDVGLLAAAGVTLSLLFSLLYAVVFTLRRLADPRVKERGAA